MRTSHKLLTILAGQSYSAYAASLTPALWHRLNEASGNAINYGSLGSTYNATPTAVTQGQAGKLGPSSAVLLDGVTSLLTIPAGPYGAYTVFTWAALVAPSGAGESNLGVVIGTENTNTAFLFNSSATSFDCQHEAATTRPRSTTTTTLTFSTWNWLFVTYDDAGDRKIRIYKGVGGVVTEYAYSAQTAAQGTLTDEHLKRYIIGNNLAASRSFAGLYDEFLLFNRVLTASEMLGLVKVTGV